MKIGPRPTAYDGVTWVPLTVPLRSIRLFIGLLISAVAFIPISAVGQTPASSEALKALEYYRYGLSVTDLQGNELVAHRADERFMPASIMKLLTSAAALANEERLLALDPSLRIALEPRGDGPPDLVLVGRGDPTIGVGPGCEARCLETLAEAVQSAGITEVSDIIGDDQWFADEPRPLGWNWDDLKFSHGTAVSALAVNDNVLGLRIAPSGRPGTPVSAAWDDPGVNYYALRNQTLTSGRGDPWALRAERKVGERTARLYGELPVGARPVNLDLGVDDPAHLAAFYFKRLLVAKGVTVRGETRARHRPLSYSDEPKPIKASERNSPLQCSGDANELPQGVVIAYLPAAPIREIVTEINQDSQNLYAEVTLRQLGRAAGNGSSFCGRLQIEKMLRALGVPRTAFDVADGSGLSDYNRITPGAITTLLSYAAHAPWGEAFEASLPVGGAPTGTLRRRFRGTILEGKIFAKTGTLNHVDAVAGYLQARSGQTLAFSIIVNDKPLDSPSAQPAIDAVLLDIASRH